MVKKYLVLLCIGMSISTVLLSMDREGHKANLRRHLQEYQALIRLKRAGQDLNEQQQAQFNILKPRADAYKKSLLEQRRKRIAQANVPVEQANVSVEQANVSVEQANVPVEIAGIRYKKIQPQENDVNLGNKATVIEGQEAFNLQESDPITQEEFKDILENRILNLAVVTTLTPATQNTPARKDREYYTLEGLRQWAQQDNARNMGYYGILESPSNRQIIINVKAFRIRNENAQPEVIANHGINLNTR